MRRARDDQLAEGGDDRIFEWTDQAARRTQLVCGVAIGLSGTPMLSYGFTARDAPLGLLGAVVIGVGGALAWVGRRFAVVLFPDRVVTRALRTHVYRIEDLVRVEWVEVPGGARSGPERKPVLRLVLRSGGTALIDPVNSLWTGAQMRHRRAQLLDLQARCQELLTSAES